MNKTALGSKAKTTTLVASLAALVVVVIVASSWKSLVVHYHLRRLRREPGYLEAVILEPEGSAARAAVNRFLDGEPGKKAFLKLYWSVAAAALDDNKDLKSSKLNVVRKSTDKGPARKGFVGLFDNEVYSAMSRDGGYGKGLPKSRVSNQDLLVALRRYARELLGWECRMEGYDWRFRRADEACAAIGAWKAFKGPNAEESVPYFEQVDGR